MSGSEQDEEVVHNWNWRVEVRRGVRCGLCPGGRVRTAARR